MKTFFRSDWSPTLRRMARTLAIVAAVLIVAAEATYKAGFTVGRAIHWLSDCLAGLASGRIDRAQTVQAVIVWAHAVLAAPAPAPAPAPVVAPVVAMACAAAPSTPPAVGLHPPALDSLPVRELRKLARAKGLSKLARNGRRAELLYALSA